LLQAVIDTVTARIAINFFIVLFFCFKFCANILSFFN
jgi:hypothetical protein